MLSIDHLPIAAMSDHLVIDPTFQQRINALVQAVEFNSKSPGR